MYHLKFFLCNIETLIMVSRAAASYLFFLSSTSLTTPLTTPEPFPKNSSCTSSSSFACVSKVWIKEKINHKAWDCSELGFASSPLLSIDHSNLNGSEKARDAILDKTPCS